MNHSKQAGFVSLAAELVACAVLMVVMAAMVPSILRLEEISNQNNAIARLRQTSQAIAAVNICAITTGCNPSAVLPLMPVNGYAMNESGYLFLFSQTGNAWTYTAAPETPGSSGLYWFYIDQTGVLRCEIQLASATSPVCP